MAHLLWVGLLVRSTYVPSTCQLLGNAGGAPIHPSLKVLAFPTRPRPQNAMPGQPRKMEQNWCCSQHLRRQLTDHGSLLSQLGFKLASIASSQPRLFPLLVLTPLRILHAPSACWLTPIAFDFALFARLAGDTERPRRPTSFPAAIALAVAVDLAVALFAPSLLALGRLVGGGRCLLSYCAGAHSVTGGCLRLIACLGGFVQRLSDGRRINHRNTDFAGLALSVLVPP